jgi:hypothetical protein
MFSGVRLDRFGASCLPQPIGGARAEIYNRRAFNERLKKHRRRLGAKKVRNEGSRAQTVAPANI